MDNDQLTYLLAFNCMQKLRSGELTAILDYFAGDAAEAWRQPGEWARAAELEAKSAAELLEQQRRLDPSRLLAEFFAAGCRVTTRFDDDYPEALRRIYDPPLLLFYHGSLPKDDQLCLAMIGSRRATPYGLQVAELLSRDLAQQGAVIVSGLARGVDSRSHRAALAAGGDTVAVLGSGLDVIYPPENERLYAEICQHGAVVSEFPLGTAAVPYNFPRRNRIISGLCRGVIVVEAGEKSGTLHTVDFALEQNRDVFAVPGPITSAYSRGTNRLLKNGAKMALSAADVWAEYSDQPLRQGAPPPAEKADELSGTERRLLALLATPQRQDQLSLAELECDAGSLAALLTILELRGLVKQLPGGYFQTVVRRLRS